MKWQIRKNSVQRTKRRGKWCHFCQKRYGQRKKGKKGEKYGSIFLIIWQKMNPVSQRKKGEENGSISAVYEAAGKETDKNAIRRMVSVWHSIGI